MDLSRQNLGSLSTYTLYFVIFSNNISGSSPIILTIFNTGHKVYKLRLDNEGENWELEDKCLKHILGIKFEYTTPNTPQHNGVVERKFQSLYNKLRATLFESGLTIELCNTLWAEYESTVTTLENICF